jgi:hypothetical protein
LKLGTRSLLFGVHQFILHPLFVALAWKRLYGFPRDPRLWVAFVVQDWGYWGKSRLDGPEGEDYPVLGARIVGKFGRAYARIAEAFSDACDPWPLAVLDRRTAAYNQWYEFVLYHSLPLATRHNQKFSRLSVADELALRLYPAWLYRLLAGLSGESREQGAHTIQGAPHKV